MCSISVMELGYYCLVFLIIFNSSTVALNKNEATRQVNNYLEEPLEQDADLLTSEKLLCDSDLSTCSNQPQDPASVIISDIYSSIRKAEENLANKNHYPPNYLVTGDEEFDFIVVGAGSAGSVVANRLSEVPEWNVLLVEAGGNPPKVSEIPALATSMQQTDIDWQYKTDPEENNCMGMVNNSCAWPRGKVLGGCSNINYMMYVRGHAKDYDNWAAEGNSGWSYEEVLPYFRKSEDIRASEVLATNNFNRYHGRGGYLKVETWGPSVVDPVMEAYGKGFEELGYPYNPDCNGETQTGFTKMQGTLEDHKRCSTAKAFLSPIKDRKNLKVAKHSYVSKILIDEKSSTAYGVEILGEEGQSVNVRVRKEVILSAGAVNSPQILMLSGIGPKEHLSLLNIKLKSDLPVGHNLQDHPLVIASTITLNTSLPEISPIDSMFELFTKGSSELSAFGATSYAAFINVESSNDYPNMEVLHLSFRKGDKSLRYYFKIMGFKDNVIDEYAKTNEIGDTIVLLGSMLRPHSRGKVSLRSTDPKAEPKIETGFLSDKRDLETFAKYYDFLENLSETKSLQRLNATLHEIRLPECEHQPFASYEFRECMLRHVGATTYHPSGSCKMAPSSDPTAVVDPTLRVIGVNRLRVIDASVMPTIVSGNINAAVIMIGEKGADMVKDSWRSR